MSARSAFYEELERYGIDASTVSKVEFKKTKKGLAVVVHANNKPVTISESYFVKLAKLAALNAPLESVWPREHLLKRLYGIITVFEGKEMPFSEFAIRNASLSEREIAERLEELERKYSVDQQAQTYKDALKIRICRKLTYEHGISFRDFEEDNRNSTIDNLVDALAKLYF